MNHKILIVEDEAIVTMEMEMKLQSRGYKNIYIAHNGIDAINLAKQNSFHLILMDIILPGEIDGIEAIEQISVFGKCPVIYITGNSDVKKNARLLETKPADVLIKPVSEWKLIEAIEKTIGEAE